MTKNHVPLFFLFILFATSLCIIGSCTKKKDAPKTLFTQMLGTWKKVKNATDDNNNGIIENQEITDTPPGITSTFEFKKDSTGIERATYSPDLAFHWYVVTEDSMLLVNSVNDTTSYKVANISSSNLGLITRIPAGLVGSYYDKN